MAKKDYITQGWHEALPWAPRPVAYLFSAAGSLPIQILVRLVMILTAGAWVVSLVGLTMFVAAIPNFTGITSDAEIDAAILAGFVVYGIFVAARITWKLRRQARTEPLWMTIMDEIGFLGWASFEGVSRLFRPFNYIFLGPIRAILLNPRLARKAIIFMIIVGVLLLLITVFPYQAIPWANQYGSGLRYVFSPGILVFMGVLLLVLILLVGMAFLTFWLEVIIIGGPLVIAAFVLAQYNIADLSWITSWATWMPTWLDDLTGYNGSEYGQLYDFRFMVEGPNGATPFGMISLGLILQWLPAYIRKSNVPTPTVTVAQAERNIGDRRPIIVTDSKYRFKRVAMDKDTEAIFQAKARRDNMGGFIFLTFTFSLIASMIPLFIASQIGPISAPNLEASVSGTLSIIFGAIGGICLWITLANRENFLARKNAITNMALYAGRARLPHTERSTKIVPRSVEK